MTMVGIRPFRGGRAMPTVPRMTAGPNHGISKLAKSTPCGEPCASPSLFTLQEDPHDQHQQHQQRVHRGDDGRLEHPRQGLDPDRQQPQPTGWQRPGRHGQPGCRPHGGLESLGVKTSELGESGEFEHDDDPGKASASSSTATDLKAFLQQLFTAIKQSSSSESTATSASATSIKSAATQSTALPSKLSNLISQVSSGKTPLSCRPPSRS